LLESSGNTEIFKVHSAGISSATKSSTYLEEEVLDEDSAGESTPELMDTDSSSADEEKLGKRFQKLWAGIASERWKKVVSGEDGAPG